ncbi:hypothetical protein C8J57DRAFT_1472215, partial [Mycena rebaudengoi]
MSARSTKRRSKKAASGRNTKSTRSSKKADARRYIDNEAIESGDDTMDSDGYDNPEEQMDGGDLEGSDGSSIPIEPPTKKAVGRPKTSEKPQASSPKKMTRGYVLVTESSSDDEYVKVDNEDKLFPPPSWVDASSLPPPVSTRQTKRSHGTKDSEPSPPRVKRQRAVTDDARHEAPITIATVRQLFGEMVNALNVTSSHRDSSKAASVLASVSDDGESSVDAEDPIDYETATILQVLADNNRIGSPDWPDPLPEGEADATASDKVAADVSVKSKGKGREMTNLERVMEAVDAIDVPEGVAEEAAYVAKTSAPYDLAAKQGLAISDYMKDLNSSGSVVVSSTKAAAVHRVANARAGTTGNKAGSKGVVFQADLETTKIKYDPSLKCGVSDPFLQDRVLSSSYKDLFPLPGGRRLLPPFVRQEDAFNYNLPGGRVAFSLWRNRIPTLDFGNAVPAILFVKARGGFINPSRIDPGRISVQSTVTDGSRYILLADGAVATCVSSVMSTESRLVHGRSIGKSLPRKWLTGMLHNQEYERFATLICMAFGVAVVYGQLNNGGLMFQTRLGSPLGTGTAKDISQSGVVSPQKGFSSPMAANRNSLGYEDNVPVYDAIGKTVNFQTDLALLGKPEGLPLFDGEIPFGSFVVVGYTVSGWNAVPSVNVDKIRHPHLGCNIMWAVVLGVRDASGDD